MNQTKQILLAFLIPFAFGVGLAFLGDSFFYPCTTSVEMNGEIICFTYPEYSTSLAETFYMFLVIGLFLTSLILPPFLTRRAYQNKRSRLEMKSITE
jgi:hypothetical protein